MTEYSCSIDSATKRVLRQRRPDGTQQETVTHAPKENKHGFEKIKGDNAAGIKYEK